MAQIRAIDIALTLSTAAFLKSSKKAQGAVSSFAGKALALTAGLKVAQSAINALSAATGGLLDPFLSLNGLASSIKKQFSELDQIGKFGDVVNVSTRDLLGLKLASDLSGVSFQTLQKGLERLTRRIGEANSGYGEGVKGLKALGLEARQLAGLDTGQAFREVANAVRDIPNAADKAAAAYSLFGRQGIELLQVLNQGGDAIDDVVAKSEELSGGISREDISRIEAANDAFTLIQYSIDGIVQQIAVEFAPYVKGVADAFLDMGVNGSSAADTIKDAFSGMIGVIKFALNAFDAVKLGLKFIKLGAVSLAQAVLLPFSYLSDAADKAYQSLKKTSADTIKSINSQLVGRTSAENFQSFVDGASKATDKAKELQTAMQGLKTSIKDVDTQTLNLIEKLEHQIKAFGLSSNQAAILKLKNEGATLSYLRLAESLAAMLEKRKALAKAEEQANQIIKDNLNPIEKYNESIANLNKLFDTGKLPIKEFGKEFDKLTETFRADLLPEDPLQAFQTQVDALQSAFGEGIINEAELNRGLAAALDKLPEVAEEKFRFSPNAQFGSQQARDIILNSRNTGKSSDPINRIAKLAEEQRDAAKENVGLLGKIEKKLKKEKVANF